LGITDFTIPCAFVPKRVGKGIATKPIRRETRATSDRLCCTISALDETAVGQTAVEQSTALGTPETVTMTRESVPTEGLSEAFRRDFGWLFWHRLEEEGEDRQELFPRGRAGLTENFPLSEGHWLSTGSMMRQQQK
jgi:hypothetical protein